jgi:hypothetical protein
MARTLLLDLLPAQLQLRTQLRGQAKIRLHALGSHARRIPGRGEVPRGALVRPHQREQVAYAAAHRGGVVRVEHQPHEAASLEPVVASEACRGGRTALGVRRGGGLQSPQILAVLEVQRRLPRAKGAQLLVDADQRALQLLELGHGIPGWRAEQVGHARQREEQPHRAHGRLPRKRRTAP